MLMLLLWKLYYGANFDIVFKADATVSFAFANASYYKPSDVAATASALLPLLSLLCVTSAIATAAVTAAATSVDAAVVYNW